MNTLIHKLEDLLVDRGWAIIDRGEDLPWWVAEQWLLRSEWKPRGFELYLNFLVDPQDDGGTVRPRPKRRARRRERPRVWAVSATSAVPAGRFEAEAGVLEWLEQRAFASFGERLDELRNAAEQGDGADEDA